MLCLVLREREREVYFSDIAYTKVYSDSTSLYTQKFTAYQKSNENDSS